MGHHSWQVGKGLTDGRGLGPHSWALSRGNVLDPAVHSAPLLILPVPTWTVILILLHLHLWPCQVQEISCPISLSCYLHSTPSAALPPRFTSTNASFEKPISETDMIPSLPLSGTRDRDNLLKNRDSNRPQLRTRHY